MNLFHDEFGPPAVQNIFARHPPLPAALARRLHARSRNHMPMLSARSPLLVCNGSITQSLLDTGRLLVDNGRKASFMELLNRMREPLLTTAAVSKWLGVSTRTLCLWAECKEIPAIKIGRQWRFRESELADWLLSPDASKVKSLTLVSAFAGRR
jgi:excisionase family DNA binding protein